MKDKCFVCPVRIFFCSCYSLVKISTIHRISATLQLWPSRDRLQKKLKRTQKTPKVSKLPQYCLCTDYIVKWPMHTQFYILVLFRDVLHFYSASRLAFLISPAIASPHAGVLRNYVSFLYPHEITGGEKWTCFQVFSVTFRKGGRIGARDVEKMCESTHVSTQVCFLC